MNNEQILDIAFAHQIRKLVDDLLDIRVECHGCFYTVNVNNKSVYSTSIEIDAYRVLFLQLRLRESHIGDNDKSKYIALDEDEAPTEDDSAR